MNFEGIVELIIVVLWESRPPEIRIFLEKIIKLR